MKLKFKSITNLIAKFTPLALLAGVYLSTSALPAAAAQSWVRFTITKKHTPKGTLDNAGLALSRFALYDASDNLLNENLSWVESTSTSLSEKQFWFTANSWSISQGKDSCIKVFTASLWDKMYFVGTTANAQALENGDPDYYVTFTMRLTDGASPTKYNLATADSGSGLQGRDPISWKVETSTTGAAGSWTTVSVVDNETPPTETYSWYKGGGKQSSSTTPVSPTTFYPLATSSTYTPITYINAQTRGPALRISGFSLQADDYIETKVVFNDVPTSGGGANNHAIFCNRQGDKSSSSFCSFVINGKLRFDYGPAGNDTQCSTATLSKDVEYVIMGDGVSDQKLTATAGSTTAATANATGTQIPTTLESDLLLFAHSKYDGSSADPQTGTGDSLARMKMYYFRVYDDSTKTTLRLDLVPVKNSNGVVGMYDRVSGNFYKSVTDKEFTAGTELPSFLGQLVLDPRNVPAGADERATGGDIILQEGDDYIHVFYDTTAEQTFTLNQNSTVDILAVGGGGPGGSASQWGAAAGGGAGGFVASNGQALGAGSYAVSVGQGGVAPTVGESDWGSTTVNTVGGDTTLSGSGINIVAKGGGGGGMFNHANAIVDNDPRHGRNGGSGGGSVYWDYAGTPGTGTTGQGFAGGQGTNGNPGAGGGAGGAASGTTPGAGLESSITGGSVVFAAGGAAGSSGNGTAGEDGLGNGGAGAGAYGKGGAGGSGIVIIRVTSGSAIPSVSTLTVTLSGTSTTYTGSSVEPNITVKDGGTTLFSGVKASDITGKGFTAQWKKGGSAASVQNAGTYTLTLTGDETTYSGTAEMGTFTVDKKMATTPVAVVTTYTGSTQDAPIKDASGITLTEWKLKSNGQHAGSATADETHWVTVELRDTNNYTYTAGATTAGYYWTITHVKCTCSTYSTWTPGENNILLGLVPTVTGCGVGNESTAGVAVLTDGKNPISPTNEQRTELKGSGTTTFTWDLGGQATVSQLRVFVGVSNVSWGHANINITKLEYFDATAGSWKELKFAQKMPYYANDKKEVSAEISRDNGNLFENATQLRMTMSAPVTIQGGAYYSSLTEIEAIGEVHASPIPEANLPRLKPQRTFKHDGSVKTVSLSDDTYVQIVPGDGTGNATATAAGVYYVWVQPKPGFVWPDDESSAPRKYEWGIVPSGYTESRNFLKTLENSPYRVAASALPPNITGGDIFLRFPNVDGEGNIVSHDFVHVFTNTAASGFVFENNSGSPRQGRALLVGGGGASGYTKNQTGTRAGHITGGGGGGGGVRSLRNLQLNGAYSLSVGHGGIPAGRQMQGTNGEASRLQNGSVSYVVAGGGGGGKSSVTAGDSVSKGLSGASGGGGAGTDGTGGAGDGDGYGGGEAKPYSTWIGSFVGAGGGGAGRSGFAGCGQGESGGYGFLTDILASPGVVSQYICLGGGGAGGGDGEFTHGKTLGGFGGGGNSFVNTTENNGETGVNGLGGGAGADSMSAAGPYGGNGSSKRGGDGIVIIRYTDTVQTPKINEVEIPAIEDTYTFTYERHDVLLKDSDVKLADTEYYTVSGDLGGVYIQEYTVTLTLRDPDNMQWSNGQTQPQTLTWSIVHDKYDDDRSFFKVLATNHNRIATAPLGLTADIVLRSEQIHDNTRYYRYELVYKDSASITFNTAINGAEVLLVGGGGAGGNGNSGDGSGGGGGGAGGVKYVKDVSFAANQAYALQVGQGGQSASANGAASTINTASGTLTAGGGGGGGWYAGNGKDSILGSAGGGGGSGAGGTAQDANLGHNGGNGYNGGGNSGGGAGGGAGGPGESGGNQEEHSAVGRGGNGVQAAIFVSGGLESQYFGGGGAGGFGGSSSRPPCSGGLGGGGSTWPRTFGTNEPGVDGLGGGGAGGSATGPDNNPGRRGGDGIIVIAFEVEAGTLIDKPTLGTDRFTYSGNEVVVTDYLSSFAHMTATGTDSATNVGDYQFAVTPASGYEWSDNSGTVAVPFEWSIAAKPIQGNITVSPIPAQTYTGSSITPVPTVRDTARNVVLTLGTDYTAEYFGNVNIGTATIKLTGIGNYTATENTTFQIIANPNENSFFVTPEGGGSGTSWEDSTTLANALSESESSDKPVAIYMKKGTYTDGNWTLPLADNAQPVSILGGYEGLNLVRSATENSVLDGGNSKALLALDVGQSSQVTLTRLTFQNGGSTGNDVSAAALSKAGLGNLSVAQCKFIGNGRHGAFEHSNDGGQNNHNVNRADFTDCAFIGNETDKSTNFGALTLRHDTSFDHCLFAYNTGNGSAGAIQGHGHGDYRLDNCTFVKNSTSNGTYPSAIFANVGRFVVHNSIFYGDGNRVEVNASQNGAVTCNYCLFKSESAKGDHANAHYNNCICPADPQFADISGDDATAWDVHLKSTEGRYENGEWVTDDVSSPAIDAGDPAADCSAEPKNSAGQNFGLNLGVYGNTAQASMSPVRATVTVTLDKGEGSGGTESVKGLEGTAMPAVTCPMRENYNFLGYFTGEAGDGTQYYGANGQPIGSPVFSMSVTTLHANWEENIHYIARPTQGTASWTYDGQDHKQTYAETDGYTVTYSAGAPWKNAGTYTVTFTLKDNWRWNSGTDTSSPIVFTYTITQREVTLNWGLTSLMYNKTAQAPTCTAGNLVSGDSCTVTVSGQKTDVGTGYTATATGLGNSNYKLPSAKTTTFSIAKKALTVEGLKATDRPYDGTTTVAIAGGTLQGVISGDTVTCEMPRSGTIADANVGTGKTVTYEALTLGGSSAGNYSVTSPSLTVNITQATITAVTLNSTSVTYDGQPHQPQVASVTANGKTFNSASTGWDVSYSRNDYTSVGTITVTATGKANLTGSASTTFTIEGPTVTLNKCGGSEGTDSVVATPGQAMPEIEPPFRNGYSFKGYFTQAEGAGDQYYNADGTSARTYPASDFPTTLYANWEFVETYYLVRKDGSSGPIQAFEATPTPGANGAGWAETPTGNPVRHTVCAEHKYVASQTLGTPEDLTAAVHEFAGDELKITNWLGIYENVSFKKLISQGGQLCNYKTVAGSVTEFSVGGEIEIVSGSQLVVVMAGANRHLNVTADISGGENTLIRFRSQKDVSGAKVVFSGDASGFNGKLQLYDDDFANSFGLYFTDSFGGSVDTLPTKAENVWFYHGGLTDGETKGLAISSTTIPARVKDSITFFGSSNFTAANFPLMTFPEGTTVNLADFTVNYATAVDGTKTPFTNLGKIVNGDNTVTLVANVHMIAKPTAVTGLVYNGNVQTGVAEGEGYTVANGSATDASSYTATATLKSGYVWSDGTTDAVSVPWSIAQATNGWTPAPALSAATFPANRPATITWGVAQFGGEATATLDEQPFTKSGALPANLSVGEHELVFTVAGTSNYTALSETINFTVTESLYDLHAISATGPVIKDVPSSWLSAAFPGAEDYQAAFISTNVNGVTGWAAYILGFAGAAVPTAAIIEKTTQSTMVGDNVTLTVGLPDLPKPTRATEAGCEVKYSLLTSTDAETLRKGGGDIVDGCLKISSSSFTVPLSIPTDANHVYYRIRIHFTFTGGGEDEVVKVFSMPAGLVVSPESLADGWTGWTKGFTSDSNDLYLQSPIVDLSSAGTLADDGYVSVDYTAVHSKYNTCYCYIDFLDAAGNTITTVDAMKSVCDGFQAGENIDYPAVFRIPLGADVDKIKVRWVDSNAARGKGLTQADDDMSFSDLNVEVFGWQEAVRRSDEVCNKQGGIDWTAFAAAKTMYLNKKLAGWTRNLPNLQKALRGESPYDARPYNILVTGDSLAPAPLAGCLEALIKEQWPNSNIRMYIAWASNTGCYHYMKEGDKANAILKQLDFTKYDCVMYTGTTQVRQTPGSGFEEKRTATFGAIDSMTTYIKTDAGAKANPNCEIIMVSPLVSVDARLPWNRLQVAADYYNSVKYHYDYVGQACAAITDWDVTQDGWADKDYNPVREQMADECQTLGIAHWDLYRFAYDYLFRSGKPYDFYQRDAQHQNNFGNHLAARVMLEAFKIVGGVTD